MSGLSLAPLALGLPPDKPSRDSPCRRLVVILGYTMSPGRYPHRGLPPHQFAPMLGAHPTFERTAHGKPWSTAQGKRWASHYAAP